MNKSQFIIDNIDTLLTIQNKEKAQHESSFISSVTFPFVFGLTLLISVIIGFEYKLDFDSEVSIYSIINYASNILLIFASIFLAFLPYKAFKFFKTKDIEIEKVSKSLYKKIFDHYHIEKCVKNPSDKINKFIDSLNNKEVNFLEYLNHKNINIYSMYEQYKVVEYIDNLSDEEIIKNEGNIVNLFKSIKIPDKQVENIIKNKQELFSQNSLEKIKIKNKAIISI